MTDSTFQPLLRSKQERGPVQAFGFRKNLGVLLLKDALPLHLWLAIGGLLNGALILTIGRIALLIPTVILLTRLTDNLLIANGLKRNPWMSNVIPGKTAAQLPNPDGTFGPKPANQSITVFHIGARTNHPLGLLAPGFKQLGNYMRAMQQDLNDRCEEFGLLNSTLYVGTERATGNEIVYIMYFNSPDGVLKFAHDELHREAWTWYNKMAATTDFSHIAIWHELFESAPGKWEATYGSSHPTLLGAARVPVKTENGKEWVGTLVDASRGVLRSSRGRLDRTDGKDNDGYGAEPFLRKEKEEKFDV